MKSIGLIALDLDGTLLDSRKRLSPRNKEALIKCARMGIQIEMCIRDRSYSGHPSRGCRSGGQAARPGLLHIGPGKGWY